MNEKLKLSILFLLLMRVSPALAQELTFTYVPTPKGSFNGSAKTVVQDPQGIMWIGQRGLHRYDGYQYTSYYHDPQNPASLIDNWVETVYATRDGMIWVGTQKHGLDRFDPATGQFTHFQHRPTDPTSLSHNIVTAILEDRDGTLWIGTEGGGLNRFNSRTKTFTRYQHNPADPASLSHDIVRALYQDRQGTLWIGCQHPFLGHDGIMQMDGGLNRFNPRTGTFTRYLHDPNNPYSLIDNRVRAIFEDSRGTFWVGTAGDGLHTMDRQKGTFIRHQYDPAQPQKLSRPPLKKTIYYVDDHITFITEDATGAIWIGTFSNGLNRYDPQTRKVKHFPNFYDPKSGVQTAIAWWACSSRDGMLWIAYNEGLFRIDPFQQAIPYVDTARPVSALYQDKAGVLWYGTDQGLVRKDPRGTQQRFVHDPHNPFSLSNNKVKTIYQDRQGTCWIGTESGLNRFEPRKNCFIRYLTANQDDSRLTNHPISCLYEDRRGAFWIGTGGGGLNRMNRQTGSFTRYNYNAKNPNGLGSKFISCLYEDRLGSLWVGTHFGGLNRLVSQDGTFQRFLSKENIQCLVQDSAGILWAGTNNGLYRSNRVLSSFSEFSDSTRELTGEDKAVQGLLEDRQQGLWIQGSAGIGRLNRRRNQTTIHIPRLDQKSQADIDFNSPYFKSANGKFYFANGSGYYAFFAEQLSRKPKALQVVIAAFRIANQPVVPSQESPLKVPLWHTQEIRLAHHQNVFSFDFVGIDYRDPERNRHLFILEHLDNTWRKAGEEKTAYYYNVPPGHYTFRVKAANIDGVWAEKAIRVVIAPPWWRTWWFVSLAASLIIGLVLAGFRYRVAQIRKEEAQKTTFNRKLSEVAMQALRAQMNPHFIFNSLNSINTFILKNQPDAASDYLAKFSRLIRLILQNSNSDTVTLQNELDALQLYLDMESLRFRHKFTFQIRVSPEVEPEEIDISPLLIQPYVENAIWHGLLHKESVGHVKIDLRVENEQLVCVIEDDGIGRQRAAELKSKSATKSKSLGMQITAHRMALMNELYGKQTTVDILDLVDVSGEACGTRVVLTMSI